MSIRRIIEKVARPPPKGSCPLLCKTSRWAAPSVPELWSVYHRYTQLGAWDEAIQTLCRILERDKKAIDALATLGDLLARRGDHAEAILAYDEGLAVAPGDRRLLFSKAHSLSYAGDHEAGIAILRSLAERNPADLDTLMAKGQCEAHIGDYGAAHRSFEQALAAMAEPSAHLLVSLGIVRSGLAKHHDAVAAFHQALYVELEQAAKRWGISQHLPSFTLEAAHLTAAGRAESAVPMVIATLPKSGTHHIAATLAKVVGARPAPYLVGGYFPHILINQYALPRAASAGGLLVEHFAPTAENVALVRFYTDRMVLHLRDPRQALLSFAHFLPAVLADLDPAFGAVYDLPRDYVTSPLEQQLDWLIVHYMPKQTAWIAGWLDAIDRGAGGLRVKITTFEVFQADPRRFYGELLTFYERPHSLEGTGFEAKPGTENFRSGRVDEWRSVFSPSQARSATEQIPDAWFSRFAWTR